jgi:hypothetical protein
MKIRPQLSDQATLKKHYTSLRSMLRRWRLSQSIWMPTVCDITLGSPDSTSSGTEGLLEEESIGMPSDLTKDKAVFDVYKDLAHLELCLREAEARETIEGIRDVVRMLCATWDEKAVHVRGYAMNTRSNTLIDDLESRRDLYIERYNHARQAILSLTQSGVTGSSNEYPLLTVKDTFRKPSSARRTLGQSRVVDGGLWMGLKKDSPYINVPSITSTYNDAQTQTVHNPVLTATTKRQPRSRELIA